MKKFSLDMIFNYEFIFRTCSFCFALYFVYNAAILIEKSFTPDQARAFLYLFFAYAIGENIRK